MKTSHHHISMITKNATENFEFYRNILGLRLINKTVNQDSEDMYHLFYGDKMGAPGTELTFFELPLAGRTVRGTNAITRIGLLVPSYESLLYWQSRLKENGVATESIQQYAGYEALPFEDFEGLRLIMINYAGQSIPANWQHWEESQIEEAHRILGMGPIELTVQNATLTIDLLTNVFSYEERVKTPQGISLQSEGKELGEFIIVEKDEVQEKPGRGSIHHIALRATSQETLAEYADKLRGLGYKPSAIIDRYYFQSIYVRDHNNIMFEIATDGPGFTEIEPIDHLDGKLNLPKRLEGKRDEIEFKLKPLK